MNIRRSKIILAGFFFLLTIPVKTFAQVKISKPRIELVNNIVIIDYDILGRSPRDTINISLDVKDNKGNKIEAKALEGDIGKNIPGGLNKRITWNLASDSLYINMDVYINIIADVIKAPKIIPKKEPEEKPVASAKEKKEPEDKPVALADEKKESTTETESKTEPATNIKEEEQKKPEKVHKIAPSVKVGKIVMLSAIVPGLGLTKLSNKKPYWLIGVAGAGCIASSVYYNYQASSNYDKYSTTYDSEKINTYFDNAEKQKLYSDIFALSAAIIWVADIGVTSLAALHKNKVNRRKNENNLKTGIYFDSVTDSPMLSLKYKF